MSAGSWALVAGSGQSPPGSANTYASLDIGSITTDPDSILSESSGVFTPQDEGFYLIVVETRLDTTNNNRNNVELQIRQNSAGVAGGYGSGYARNTGNNFLWCTAGVILHFDGSTDTWDVRHRYDGAATGTYGFTRAKVVQLSAGDSDSLPYGHYGTPTSAALGGSSPTNVTGWDVITENSTGDIQLVGNDIALKNSGLPYLIVYGLPTDAAGGNRTGRISDLTIDGTRIPHSAGQEYQRNSASEYCAPSGMALATISGEEQNLNARVWGTTITSWGTFSDGSWTLSAAAARAGITVIGLPSTLDFAIFSTTTNQAGFAEYTMFTTEDFASSTFEKDSSQIISTPAATEMLAYGSVLHGRTATSGSRSNLAMRWGVNGGATTDTEYGDYLRGDQGSQDHYNCVYSSLLLDSTSIDDEFNLERYNPGSQDAGTSNDLSEFGGAFFIDLSTLAEPSNDSVGSAAATDTRDTIAGTGTATPPPSDASAAITDTRDTISGTGTADAPPSDASAALTDTRDTLAGTGEAVDPTATATAAVTDTRDTLAGSGAAVAPTATGTASPTDTRDTLAGSGSASPPGADASVALTDTRDTLSGVGAAVDPTATASAALTDTRDTLAGVGEAVQPTADGTGAPTDTRDTLSGVGSATEPTVTGSLAETDTRDTISGAGAAVQPTATGTAALTDTRDTLAGSGSFSAPRVGTLAATDTRDTLSASGTSVGPAATATAAPTDTRDTLAGTGEATQPTATASMAETDTRDTLAGVGEALSPGSYATMAETDTRDTLTGTGEAVVPSITATMASTDTRDTLAGVGVSTPPVATGSLAETDTRDTLAGSGVAVQPQAEGEGSPTDERDTLAGTGQAVVPTQTGSMGATDTRDTIAGVAQAGIPASDASMAAADTRDTLAASGAVVKPTATAALSQVDGRDVIVGVGVSTKPTATATMAVTDGRDSLTGRSIPPRTGSNTTVGQWSPINPEVTVVEHGISDVDPGGPISPEVGMVGGSSATVAAGAPVNAEVERVQ